MTPSQLRERLADFAAAVVKFSRPLLRDPAAHDPARQLMRSAASAAANHRAAGRGRSHAEFTAKLGVALEESDEAEFWLEHLRRSDLVPAETVRTLLAEAGELVAILGASHETARRRQGDPATRGHWQTRGHREIGGTGDRGIGRDR